jgi:hypothetical protein
VTGGNPAGVNVVPLWEPPTSRHGRPPRGPTPVPLRRRSRASGIACPVVSSMAPPVARGVGRGCSGSRTPASPGPRPSHSRTADRGSTRSPAPGFCSTTIRPSVACAGSGGPSGSALTATSRADARTRRAVSHSSPVTSGTTTSGPSRAAATSSVAASSVACHSPVATSSVAGRTSSRSRHRSHADCRVTPSRVAISAQLFARPRAARTADSSAWSNSRRSAPMSDSASSAASPSAVPRSCQRRSRFHASYPSDQADPPMAVRLP